MQSRLSTAGQLGQQPSNTVCCLGVVRRVYEGIFTGWDVRLVLFTPTTYKAVCPVACLYVLPGDTTARFGSDVV